MLLTLLESTATTAKQPSGLFWVIYIVILVGFMWLLIIRPQKKHVFIYWFPKISFNINSSRCP